MKAPVDRKIPAKMDLDNAERAAEFFALFLGDVGANLEHKFPEFASMLPRCFIWAAASKLVRDFGPEAAATVLEQIAAMIRDGALDPEMPDIPPQTPPGTTYN